MKRLYNRVKDKHDPRDHKYSAMVPIEIPDIVDLRPGCSAVENQGELGSCTAHAIVGALEYDENKQRETPLRLSRLFVYYGERALDGTINEDSGAEIRDGIKVIAQLGCCDETLCPYVEENFKLKPSLEAYNDALKHKAIQYRRVNQSEDDLLHALASGYPIAFGIYVYDSLESDEVAANGMVPMPNVNAEECLGGHAVLIVGYDRIKRLFTIRNSWGPDWGDKGYFYLPFDYVLSPELAEDFWTVTSIE